MNLKSLLLCSDEKITRVLRRTLGDLEIGVEHCTDSEEAVRKLTRERFEAIIVDCAGFGAAAVLGSARSAPCNKRAVAVAILDPEVGLRSAFDVGAHFILYKPVSAERAKSSFRAARALMKKERRHNARIPVAIPVEMSSRESSVKLKVVTTDLGEGGLAVSLPRRNKLQGRWQLSFILPDSSSLLEVDAEFAWEGTGTQVGLRFHDQSEEFSRELREWLKRNSSDGEKDDPPVRCQLAALSTEGCYLEFTSPFPISTRVTISIRAAGAELKTEGVVRIMHADRGMGVEFTRTTADRRASLEKFLSQLAQSSDAQPEVLVEPEGLETELAQSPKAGSSAQKDTLLELFRKYARVPADQFFEELRKDRSLTAVSTSA